MQLSLSLNQRWSGGRASYRPPTEPIRAADYEVAEIPDDATARQFVEIHHYSRTYPAARLRVGLYRHGTLAGVAVFSHPCSSAVLTNVFPGPVLASVELGRFVLLDEVEGNGETWFLRRCFDLLRSRAIRGVVSFSDPLPRRDDRGAVVHRGHVGTIYQAFSGYYLGRSTPRTLRLLPDGRVFSDRAIQKVRAGERGWKYASGVLETYGAAPAPEEQVERSRWLAHWLNSLTTPVRHRGNHRYAWALSKPLRAQLAARALPYPKFTDPMTLTCGADVG